MPECQSCRGYSSEGIYAKTKFFCQPCAVAISAALEEVQLPGQIAHLSYVLDYAPHGGEGAEEALVEVSLLRMKRALRDRNLWNLHDAAMRAESAALRLYWRQR